MPELLFIIACLVFIRLWLCPGRVKMILQDMKIITKNATTR